MASNVYGGPDPAAAGKVATPALVIQILAGLSVLANLVSVAWNILIMVGAVSAGSGDARFSGMMSGGISLALNALGIFTNAFIIFGAQKMKSLEGYGMAMAACILMMLPCSCCCIINLPVGIWGLVTLMDANVKASFRG